MAVHALKNNFTFSRCFVFQDNNILVTEKGELPDSDAMRRIVSSDITSDAFSEDELSYAAAMIKSNAAVPEGFIAIPLRQFFWQNTIHEAEQLSARAHSILRLRETYRFCPSCAAPLTDDEHFTAKVCTKCGSLLFPRIEPAVIVLVRNENKILLVKSKSSSGNFFSCVAGFVELGESIEEAAVREVNEETGIKIKNLKYKKSRPWPFPDQLMFAFTAEYESGEIRMQEEEIEDAGWFPLDSLPETPRPGSIAYELIHGITEE